MRAGNVVGRLSMFQFMKFRLFILWVPVCPVSSFLGGFLLDGGLLWAVFLGVGGVFFSSLRMFVTSFVVVIVGYWLGFEFLQESVIRPLKAGLKDHWVRCSVLQIIQFPVFVEILPEKLGR